MGQLKNVISGAVVALSACAFSGCAANRATDSEVCMDKNGAFWVLNEKGEKETPSNNIAPKIIVAQDGTRFSRVDDDSPLFRSLGVKPEISRLHIHAFGADYVPIP